MSSLVSSIRSRQTEKVLVNPDQPLPPNGSHESAVDTLLADAAWAPFHYPTHKSHRNELDSPVPWRFYKVDTAGCRALMAQLNGPDSGASKIAAMLAGADALIQATWLPDPSEDSSLPEGASFAGTQRNMEHIAAAAAAVQSFLLLATEAGYKTYWSSGGVLRSPEVFAQLKIPTTQVLLGSIFLFPQTTLDAEIKPGAWRNKRGEVADWSVWRSVVG